MKKKSTDAPMILQRNQPKETIVIQIKLKTRAPDGKLKFTQSKAITVVNISFNDAYARVEKAFQ